MKNYSLWMNSSNSGEEAIFDECEKSSIKINNVVVEAIVNNANEWQKNVDNIFLVKKTVSNLRIGDVITYLNKEYLVYFETEDRDFYWSAKARLCNNTLPLTGIQTETQIGTDEFGRPINEYVPTSPTLLPCIVESSIYQPKEDSVITLPNGKILVTIPYTIHDDISDNKEFELYGEKYKIVGIDRTKSVNEVGLMILHCERVI